MLYGVEEQLAQLGRLERSPYIFHLTGSRYFGCERQDSDWDFLVVDQPELQEYLLARSFRNITDVSYDDMSIIAVYEKDGVHIQVIDSLLIKTKLAAQKLLRELGIRKPSNAQWNALLSSPLCISSERRGEKMLADVAFCLGDRLPPEKREIVRDVLEAAETYGYDGCKRAEYLRATKRLVELINANHTSQ